MVQWGEVKIDIPSFKITPKGCMHRDPQNIHTDENGLVTNSIAWYVKMA